MSFSNKKQQPPPQTLKDLTDAEEILKHKQHKLRLKKAETPHPKEGEKNSSKNYEMLIAMLNVNK